jgi:hypothetical protein
MESFYSWDKAIWSTQNNVQLNRDDTGRVLSIKFSIAVSSLERDYLLYLCVSDKNT